HRLALTAGADYAQPPGEGTAADPRVPGGTYMYSLTQRELALSAGVLARLPLFGDRAVPFVQAGPRLYLLETKASGAAEMEDFGQHTETSTQVGAFLTGGVDVKLGVGTLVGEIVVAGSPLPHRITGTASTGELELRVGYRLWL